MQNTTQYANSTANNSAESHMLRSELELLMKERETLPGRLVRFRYDPVQGADPPVSRPARHQIADIDDKGAVWRGHVDPGAVLRDLQPLRAGLRPQDG